MDKNRIKENKNEAQRKENEGKEMKVKKSHYRPSGLWGFW